MLEIMAGADVTLALILEGFSLWWEEDKILQSVQEVQYQNNHIYPLNMDYDLLQIPIQGAQWVFAPSHIYFLLVLNTGIPVFNKIT